MGGLVCAVSWLLLSTSGIAASPAMQVVRGSASGAELVGNGQFEQASGGKLSDWTPGPKGFVLAPGEGRRGSRGIRCDNPSGAGWYGASQTVALNRTKALPLIVRGWSKADNVSSGADSDYSLYVDILYTDGTPLWGQTADFRTGTHDWEARELLILPEKPVKSLTLHCLFRNHSGKVWFDDLSVEELRSQAGTVLFQGVPATPGARLTAAPSAGPQSDASITQTRDGLKLVMRDNTVASLSVSGTNLASDSPSGFLARDVGADSDFYAFEGGACSELGLKLKAQFRGESDHIVIEGRLSDFRGKDRAVTLVFALPLDALGWHWNDDIRHSRLIEGAGEFSKLVSIKCGATGSMSLYPLAAISSQTEGLALAIDMGQPAQYRLGYHAGTRQLFIAYDFGLAPDTERFPSSADFRFVLYRFDPRWGFRAAFQKLTTIFPDYFVARSREQGLWMPFTDIRTVQGWEDFGFRYHEGDNNVVWDDAHGVLSFRYTEPMTWWMRMPTEAPRTIPEALRLRDELARGPRQFERQMAEVSQVAAMWDETGQPCLLFRNEPWCNGAVWSFNPNPFLPAVGNVGSAGKQGALPARYNAATVHWNQALRQALYGPGAKGKLDGEYLDSLEGYVTSDLNFRREHFRYTTVPLTFSSETRQPALFKGLAVFEFTRWFCGQVHQLGKLTFANGVPYRFTYLCPWLDVLGTETDWLREGQYRPASDEQMSLWRTMSGAKPYLLLMNTDFDIFTSDMVERYFERSLFYGMFPGMFSHNAADNPYWQNPKWYNRDRPLFKKFMPLIRRVAQAGWQPVTEAACDNSNIFIERFGPEPGGTVLLTLFNGTGKRQQGKVHVQLAALGLAGSTRARELISSKPLEGAADWEMDLASQEVNVVELSR
ncbi:MAG TPA: hypothetical protein VG146_12500 [Verrucomicrobiae bacterium]|nr:hypothetical protein [Verrucomicrobiae bacterium]